jgi:hypothetical protein
MSLEAAQILVDAYVRETRANDVAKEVRTTPFRYWVSLTDGTGASEAQIAWSDSRTLASGSESLTLTGISDTRDGAAVTVAFSAVKAVVVKNTHPTLSVTFSGAFTAWPLKPNGMVVIVDPSADGVTGNTLTVSGGAGVTYDIIVIGEGTVT